MASNSLKWIHLVSSGVGQQPFINPLDQKGVIIASSTGSNVLLRADWIVARGEIVDEEALVAALRSGRLSGAALDAHTHEPRLLIRRCGTCRT